MQYTIFGLIALATTALASPTPMSASLEERQYGVGINPNVIFTNATCTLDKAQHGFKPLNTTFPTAAAIGRILGPKLKTAIGAKGIMAIDKVGEDICISADQDPADGAGPCNDALQAVYNVAAHTDQAAVDKYICLLNLLCVAQESPNNAGTCQALLAGVDCVANRILDSATPECKAKGAVPYPGSPVYPYTK